VNKQLGLNNIQLLNSHWAFLSKGSLPYDRMMELPARLRAGPIIASSKDVVLYYALYLPEEEATSGQALNTKTPLVYDEKAASYYWGLNIAVDSLPYSKISEIQNHKQVCLDAVKDFAPEFRQMFSVGDDDPDILVTQLRASTRPKANWRAQARKTGTDAGHARVWIIGDAVHTMQPNRGQGGNQAMADCAEMLPQLLRLNTLANNGPAQPTPEDFIKACDSYEATMIPRAFEWVKKSGGTSIPRVNLDGFLGTFMRLMASLVMPLLRLYFSLVPPKKEE
jgi:hypothetical protein